MYNVYFNIIIINAKLDLSIALKCKFDLQEILLQIRIKSTLKNIKTIGINNKKTLKCKLKEARFKFVTAMHNIII